MVKLLSADSGSVLIHCGNGDDGELRYERAGIGLFTDVVRYRLRAHLYQVGQAKEQQKRGSGATGVGTISAWMQEAVNRRIEASLLKKRKKKTRLC